MKISVLAISFLFCSLFSFAQDQDHNDPHTNFDLKPLTKADEKALKALPELKLPNSHKDKLLPAIVDNSTQPYMRTAFQQDGLSCGQAAGIAYNYTYEIDWKRNLIANTDDNLYPTHFTWNWMHGGYGWYGVSYLHSFQVLKHCGSVNVLNYGGTMSFGGHERWMSGYTDYYRGMSNRINSVYQINVGTPEGLETFKHWINDHMEGAAVGGVGSFYSQYMAVGTVLPPGTPEAGKYVLTYFGGSANHAQTIVGYNDSIRWDYNNDGQYTNHIDINGDGIVDMKDWEIGGFKMVQSYGGVPNWGNQGYAYMMYKTVADELGQGGIWNHSVHVLKVKEDVDPQATMKVSLTHDSRNKIKVIAGVSNDTSATFPEYRLEYPIFNYQGGNQYMQGGTALIDHKTIEFGLDISPLLGEINLDQDVKFFLQVYEYDPTNAGTGQINYFSVYDYTGYATEIQCPQTNVPIVEHGLTSLSLIANFSFDRVHIVNSTLPPATTGQPYNHQLVAAGGEAPYVFRTLKLYDEEVSTETFPMISQYQLNPGNNGSGFVSQALDFDFPYYDSSYSSVTVHVDGYLMFDEQLYPYPYFYDDMNMFRITRHISPLMCHSMYLYSSNSDGIWYEGDSTKATFRWQASIDGSPGSTEVNVAVSLYPSGKIEFHYGDVIIGDDILWVPGLCDGNDEDFQFSGFYTNALPSPNTKYEYTRYNYPDGIAVSEDGMISGTVLQSVNGEEITFKVTDNNFVYAYKTLIFATTGVMIMDSIASGGDDVIDYGEIVAQSVELTNLTGDPINDAEMTIAISDPYVTLFDDYEYVGTIAPGETVELINAFSFQVASDIPDEHLIEIFTSVSGTNQTWDDTLFHFAYAPEIEISDLTIDDGNNGLLDPGETCDIIVNIINIGGSQTSNLDCLLETSDPYITINQASVNLSLLEPDSSASITFNVSADAGAPIGHLAEFILSLSDEMGYVTDLPLEIRIGFTVEDFETGDFSLFTWGFKGNRDWMIDEQNPYEGEWCARSGNISHSQHTSMIMDVEVLEEGEISFFRKVSCQDDAGNNSDYLAFYIDETEMGRWDSILDWEQVSFTVEAGYHRFEWRYSKDGSSSAGMDAAFVDFISLPSCLDLYPHLVINPEDMEKTMLPDASDTDTIFLSNPVHGEIEYEIFVTAANKDSGSGRSIAGSYLECEQTEFYAGDSFLWNFTLYNGSDDNEWLQNLDLQFPEGIDVDLSTNFTGGSGGDMAFTGSFGNGPLLNWWGEDASGWGVVYGGEYAYAEIGGTISPDFTEDAVLEYMITGDIYGNDPHTIEGQLVISNLGGNISWLSCNTYEGIIAGQGVQEVLATYNTAGMEDGHYYCNIVVKDNFQHETIIPVHLIVDTDIGIQEISYGHQSTVFPNPFREEISISIDLAYDDMVNIRIFDHTGKIREIIMSDHRLVYGHHSLTWHAGENYSNGLYFILIETETDRRVHKVILNK